MKRLILLALLSLTATSAIAGWTNGEQVVENIIWTPDYKGFYVRPGTFHDPQNCGASSTRMYLIDSALDPKEVDRLYAMLLTAWSNGGTVYVWLNGCHPYPAPRFSGLQINK